MKEDVTEEFIRAASGVYVLGRWFACTDKCPSKEDRRKFNKDLKLLLRLLEKVDGSYKA